MRKKFHIEDQTDRYRLHNLEYNGDFWDVDWRKDLLGHGHTYNPADWIARTEDADWKLPPATLYISTFIALYDNQDGQKDLVNRLKKKFKKDFEERYFVTSTLLNYTKKGPDTAVHWFSFPHWFKYPYAQTIRANLIKPGDTLGRGSEDFCEAALGTRDYRKINRAATWLTGERPRCLVEYFRKSLAYANLWPRWLSIGGGPDLKISGYNDGMGGNAHGVIVHGLIKKE